MLRSTETHAHQAPAAWRWRLLGSRPVRFFGVPKRQSEPRSVRREHEMRSCARFTLPPGNTTPDPCLAFSVSPSAGSLSANRHTRQQEADQGIQSHVRTDQRKCKHEDLRISRYVSAPTARHANRQTLSEERTTRERMQKLDCPAYPIPPPESCSFSR